MKKALLKNAKFAIRSGASFDAPAGEIVNIIDEEEHFVYGKRYMIEGYDAWFEEKCFEYVDDKEVN